MTAAARRADLRDLSLDRLDPNPGNPRFDTGDVTDLAASISEQGLLEPLIVAPSDLDGRFTIIAGHRRAEACRKAGLTTTLALVRKDLDTRSKQIAAMLVENLQRADLTPIEEAAAYQQLTLEGLDVATISEQIGRTASVVGKRLKLMTLSSRTREKIHDRRLTLELAEQLAEFADDPKLLKKLEGTAPTGLEWAMKQARKERKDAAAMAKLAAKLEKEHVTVIDPPTGGKRVARLDELPGKVTPSKHAKCPGHAAWISNYWDGPKAVYVCLQPKVHPAPKGMKAPTPTKRKLNLAFVAASEARLTHVRTAIASGKLDPFAVIREMAIEQIDRAYSEPAMLAAAVELLGLEPPKRKKAAAYKQTLSEHLRTCKKASQIAGAMLAVQAAQRELIEYSGLRISYGWTHSGGDRARTWIELLEATGWKRTDFETAHLRGGR